MTQRTHLGISADNNTPADAIRVRLSPPPLSLHCANFSFFNLAFLSSPPPRIFVLRRTSVLISFTVLQIPDRWPGKKAAEILALTRAPRRVRNFPVYSLNQSSTERLPPFLPLSIPSFPSYLAERASLPPYKPLAPLWQ